jgi:hypothetical protein
MEKDLLNKLKPLFVYTKNIGECIIIAEMELRDVNHIDKTIKKVDGNGATISEMPMIGMFKTPITEILEMYGDEMIRHLDSENDDDYHSPIITIYPDQKKIVIRDFAYFVVEDEKKREFHNLNEQLLEDMREDEVRYFEFDYWGSWDDRELEFQYVRGDDNVVPGLIQPYYRFFVNMLNDYFTGWDSEEGSYGTIYVNDREITVVCNYRTKEWGWTGFEKTLNVNS